MHRLAPVLLAALVFGCVRVPDFDGKAEVRPAPSVVGSHWIRAGEGAVFITYEGDTSSGRYRLRRVDADGLERSTVEVDYDPEVGGLGVASPSVEVAYLFAGATFGVVTEFDDEGLTERTVQTFTGGLLVTGRWIVANEDRVWVAGERTDGEPRIAEWVDGVWSDAMPLYDPDNGAHAAPGFEVRSVAGEVWLSEVQHSDGAVVGTWRFERDGWEPQTLPEEALPRFVLHGAAFDGSALLRALGNGELVRWDALGEATSISPIGLVGRVLSYIEVPGDGFLAIHREIRVECGHGFGFAARCWEVPVAGRLMRLLPEDTQWRELTTLPLDYQAIVLLNGEPWLWASGGLARVDLSQLE